MKKWCIITILLLLSMFSFPAKSVQAQNALRIYIDPSSVVGEGFVPGGNVTFYVKVEGVPETPGVCGVQFKVEWDTAVLKGVKLEIPSGHFMDPEGVETAEGNLWIITKKIYDGYAEYAVTYYDIPAAKSRGTAPRHGNGTLAKITLNIVGVGETAISLKDTILADETATPLDCTVENGHFNNTPQGVLQEHDVAIIKVETASPIIYANWSINVKTIVSNNGSFVENLTVTLYYDHNFADNKSITNLFPGETFNVTLTWNTSETTQNLYVLYTIKVEAAPVKNETAVDNNTFTDETVTVVILGDANGDKVVNILDVIVVSNAFGSTPEDPNWNILGDLNSDGRITVNDLILIARCFGQRWT